MANTAEKLNTFFRYPYALARMGLSGATGRVASVIFSFSNRRRDTDAECVLTRTGLAATAGVSVSSAARALGTLRNVDGYHQREEYGRRRYALHIDTPGGCFRRYRFLFEHQFEIGGRMRRLTALEEEIVSFFLSHLTNPNARRGVETSCARLAAMFGRSEDAVGAAIGRLLRAGIIHRPRRGTNRSRLSRYSVDKSLRKLAVREEETPKKETASSPTLTRQETDHEARAARERHYAPVRAHAIALADAANAKAEHDADYARVRRELAGLDPQIARAEVNDDRESAAGLILRRKSLMVTRARILARLGLSEQDLRPQWHCPVCEDTGFRLSDGKMCTCWRPPKGVQP